MTKTKLLIALGYGVYLLYAYASGALYFYIHPIYIIPAVVTGAVILALVLTTSVRRPSAAAEHDASEQDREPLSPLTLALLVVPLVLGFLLPPKPLGLATAAQRGIDAAPLGRLDDVAEFRVEQRPETYSIKDWVKAMQVDPEPSRHAGRPVQVSGFVYRDKRYPEDVFFVSRFVVQCCAVDATPVGLPVRATGAEVPEEGKWVAVEGTWEVAEVGGQRKAVVAPTSLKPIERPGQPYLY
jgi:uncharacterized repeat protein (TIGR03943 family)